MMIPEAQPERSSPARPGADQVTAVVLCGGESRRMGRDKAMITLGQDESGSLLDHALTRLGEHARRGLVACGAEPRYQELVDRYPGWELVLDSRSGQGPLAGLCAALERCTSSWLLVAAVDMPGFGARELGSLLEGVRPGVQIVCFEDPDGPQPLLALYHRDCLAAVRRALDAGQRRMISFWRDVEVRTLPIPGSEERLHTVAGSEQHRGALRNLNTPADLKREDDMRPLEDEPPRAEE